MAKTISYDDFLRFLGLARLAEEHDKATRRIDDTAARLLGMCESEIQDFYRTHAYDALHGNRDSREAMRLMGIEIECPVIEPKTTFKVGDVVRHKRGGPPMCIDLMNDRGEVACVWLAAGSPRRATFALSELEHTLSEAPDA